MLSARTLPIVFFPPSASTVSTLMDETVSAMETYKDHLLGLDWEKLLNQSAVLSGLADKLLRDIQARSELEELGSDHLSERDSALRNMFSEIASNSSPTSTQWLSELLAQLTQQNGGDTSAAQEVVDKLLDGSSGILHSRKRNKSLVARDEELLVSSYVQLSSSANIASVEATIRLAYNKTQNTTTASIKLGDVSLIEGEISKLQGMLEGGLDQLYNSLKDSADSVDYLSECIALQSSISKHLPVSAMIAGGCLALVKRTNSNSEKSAQYGQILSLLELIQRLQVLHAYTGMVRAEMAGIDPGRWYSHEKRRVDNRQMASTQPKGVATEISGLSNAGLADGTFVSVRGLVQNLRVEDDPSPPKFSTFFDLLDIESGEKIQIRAHMFSLINNGLADNAYTNIHGFIRKNEPWVTDIGVEIDRLSLTQLRRDSWYDDITYRVRKFYRLYIDEMNMFNTPFIG